MNKLKILILLTVAFQQCQSFALWDFFWNNYFTNKDSIYCYRKLTLKFLQRLQDTFPDTQKCNLKDRISAFESQIQPRAGMAYMLVAKNGRNSESFHKRMMEAEGIVNGAITEYEKCLAPECAPGIEESIKQATAALKYGSQKCGDPSYLKVPVTNLEQACSKLKKAPSLMGSTLDTILSPINQLSFSEMTNKVTDYAKQYVTRTGGRGN